MYSVKKRKVTRPEIKRASIRDWQKGYISALDDGRMPQEGLKGAGNVVLDQNGTIRPRPSSISYGIQPTGTVLGQVFPYTRLVSGSVENWEMCMMNVSGTTQVYARKDGLAWAALSGKTYDNTATARFTQLYNRVLVANGVDNLSYVDTSTNTVVPFVSLTTPSAPTVTQSGMVGTTYINRYRITAVNQGETAGSTVGSVTVAKERSTWAGATEFIDITWNRVTNAEAYNIYYAQGSGDLEYLGSARDPGTGTTVSFRDDGTIFTDVTTICPEADSTAGPKVKYVATLNDRAFMWGDKDDKYKIWYGGVGNNATKFNPFVGGGYTRVGNGTKYYPNSVSMFRDHQGNPAIQVLCRGGSGTGKRYKMQEVTQTFTDQTITVFSAQEESSQDGTDSPDGVLFAKDSLLYPSRGAFKSTGTKANLQNVLSTNGISDQILQDVTQLNPKYMDKCVGLVYENRAYWALPASGASSNNQIWTLDLTRGGAWMLPWYISANWLWVYEDNSGVSHFCYLTPENTIKEFTYSQATNDDGVAFSTSVSSGIIKFSDDGQEWANVLDVTFILLRPQGQITATISGRTEEASLSTIGNDTFEEGGAVSGWSEYAWSSYGYEGSGDVPISFSDARASLTVEVDEELQWWKWDISSTGTGADYQISDIIIRYVPIGTKDDL